MAEAQVPTRKLKFEEKRLENEFLPNLCLPSSVFSLVLVGELLALALALDDGGLRTFSWQSFGLQSFLIQWVLLTSAGTICMFRQRFNRWGGDKAYLCSFLIILGYTILFSGLGQVFILSQQLDVWGVLSNMGIAAIFSGVLMRYMYLQQRLKLQQEAELGARVLALQSRIRPHFLFNSLNSIASLIMIRPEAAEKMVVDLAHLFRASLKLPELSAIEDEIALCRCFADIEKIRLGSRLNVNWLIHELPPKAQILNLLLQPLIENAIYHGIQPMPSGGVVDIEIKEMKGDVLIKITNPVQLENQRQIETESRGNGIALANIRSRLEAHYGKKAYLRVVKGQAEFTVILRYPAIHDDKR